MELILVEIPITKSKLFESNFCNKIALLNGKNTNIRSVGHSWSYPTKIKGWQDWDYPTQQWGVSRNVATFSINKSDRIVTVIRNPFDLLFNYFRLDWAWCKTSHQMAIDSHTKEDFQKFVDIYLDDNIPFHVPAFKKSLFSQLKDSHDNWIINSDSIVIRFERLSEDINIFSKISKIPWKCLF